MAGRNLVRTLSPLLYFSYLKGEAITSLPQRRGDYFSFLKGEAIMVSFRLRNILLDALAVGPPYKVSARQVSPVLTHLGLLKELEQRGLITSSPDAVLTEAGISEAKWFADSANPLGATSA